MARIFTILFLLSLNCTVVSAQKQFAPVGAEWYNEMQFGIFHSVAVSDTVIDGQPCRKIVQRAGRNAFHASVGPFVYDMPTVYMHNNGTGDTIFLYNNIFNKFTPLYVFKVQPGDTVCLPLFQPHGSAIVPKDDSTFCFVVDSIKMVQYDTAWLETVYNHSINLNGYVEYSYNGPYIRDIVSVTGGLLPFCNTCIYPLTNALQWAGELRCYHDEHTSIKLVSDTCSKGIKVSVDELTQGNTVKVFPNPANEKLMIVDIDINAKLRVSISDMQGRVVLSQIFTAPANDATVDIAALVPGVYLLQLFENDMPKGYSRVVVAK